MLLIRFDVARLLMYAGMFCPRSRQPIYVTRVEGIGWLVVVVYGSTASRTQPDKYRFATGLPFSISIFKFEMDVDACKIRVV
jgi:hypothetical protein